MATAAGFLCALDMLFYLQLQLVNIPVSYTHLAKPSILIEEKMNLKKDLTIDILSSVQKPARYTGGEFASIVKPAGFQ